MNRKCTKLWVTLLYLSAAFSQAKSQAAGFTASTSRSPDTYGFVTVSVQNKSQINITSVQIFHSCQAPNRAGPTTSTVGFDAGIELTIGSGVTDKGMLPNAIRTFDVGAEEAACPGGISVLFADGHGEGVADGPSGWKQTLIDRRATYLEAQVLRNLIQKMPAQDPDFSEMLLATVEARRNQVMRYPYPDFPPEESRARQQLVDRLRRDLMSSPGHPPPYLKDKASTLLGIDQWISALKTFAPNNTSN